MVFSLSHTHTRNSVFLAMEEKKGRISVLMLPWLAHGHISPFLELAKKLIERNFYIYFCSTSVNLVSIEKKLSEKEAEFIEFVELKLPSLPELPPERHTTNGLPPHLMTTLKTALEMSSPHFSGLLDALNPDIVIYDFNQPWAAETASSRKIPAVQFLPIGATFASFGLNMLQNPGEEFPFPEIYLREYEKNMIQGLVSTSVKGITDKDRFFDAVRKSNNIILIKSCREIEGKYMDFLGRICNKKIVPVGLLVQNPVQDENQEITEWLNKQEKKSVVFISFGSEYFLSAEETLKVAKALENDKINFIWVLRYPSGEQKPNLPRGFLDRVRNRGMVVENWAPQARILGHPSVGGFVSHCGWSSIMESIHFGVPIIAMPMQIDQPMNARLVEALGVGMEVLRDKNGKLQSEEICRVMRKVVLDEDGEEIRRKMSELSSSLKTKGGEPEIDGVVEELKGLVSKRNVN